MLIPQELQLSLYIDVGLCVLYVVEYGDTSER